LALAACSPSRPDHAYRPDYDSGACAPIPGIPNSCQPDINSDDTSSDDLGDDDPGIGDGFDAGPVDPANPLAKLAGRYLMRVDYYSTATATESGYTLSVQNRLSNMFLTTLTPGDGVLHAEEKLCAQGSAHKCLQNSCSDWKTLYDDGLPAVYAEKMSGVRRDWRVDIATGQLDVPGGAMLALGFDPTDDQYTFPPDLAAANVWQAGTTNDPLQRGMHTLLTGKLLVSPPLYQPDLRCNVNTAMLFGTAFHGSIDLQDERTLNNLLVEVDASLDAKVLDASGVPAEFCDKTKLSNAPPSEQKVFVRFLKVSSSSACPKNAAAYGQAFPLPGEVELSPPLLPGT
jgi:hypothetical protein